MRLTVNGETHDIDAPAEMPLLWALRDELNVTGPKFGCGIAMCGACTVHIDGRPVRSCTLPVGAVRGEVTTIESVSAPDAPPAAKAVQAAWVEHQVAQCGYCQPGQIMSAAAFLDMNPDPTDEAIDAAMSANLCRCATYPRIRAAIRSAAAALREG